MAISGVIACLQIHKHVHASTWSTTDLVRHAKGACKFALGYASMRYSSCHEGQAVGQQGCRNDYMVWHRNWLLANHAQHWAHLHS
jgi:hypothetical protein